MSGWLGEGEGRLCWWVCVKGRVHLDHVQCNFPLRCLPIHLYYRVAHLQYALQVCVCVCGRERESENMRARAARVCARRPPSALATFCAMSGLCVR